MEHATANGCVSASRLLGGDIQANTALHHRGYAAVLDKFVQAANQRLHTADFHRNAHMVAAHPLKSLRCGCHLIQNIAVFRRVELRNKILLCLLPAKACSKTVAAWSAAVSTSVRSLGFVRRHSRSIRITPSPLSRFPLCRAPYRLVNSSPISLGSSMGLAAYSCNTRFSSVNGLRCWALISSERFMEKIWGYDSETERNVVWVYISYLRKKLTALHADIKIKAVRNVGYTLEEIV